MGSLAANRDDSIVVDALLAPLRDLLERPDVTELSINRPNEVWAIVQGSRERHIVDMDMTHLERLANAILFWNGLTEHETIASVLMPRGERAQIVKAPACLQGTLSLSIRKHASAALSLETLDAQGAFDAVRDVSFNLPSAEDAEARLTAPGFARLDKREVELLALKREGRWREFLEAAVRLERNIVVAGKTGSGKTTLTRSLIEKVPAEERIITIEDVHELDLPNHPNKVHMLYGNSAKVTAEQALRSCMRQSPDRIFLAELRGNEAWEYINSLNTGHPGSITTTHANSAILTYSRIAALIKNSDTGSTLDYESIMRTLEQTVHIVLFIHARKLVEVFYDPIFARNKLA